jgi:protein TonB
MDHSCTLPGQESLHPASNALPEGGPGPRVRSRLRLPWTARTIRVRSLALWVSLCIHAALFAVLCASRLDAPPQEAPPLIDIEFVEIPGPKGGGGHAPAAAPSAKAFARLPAPQAVAVPHPAARQAPAPDPAQALAATAAPANAAGGGSSSGSGGGTGGGQGTGAGAAVGGGGGQGGIAVDRMPVVVRKVKPVYPMDARRRGISGQVTLRLYVDAEGGVREVQVQSAEPSGIFEEKAVEAARKWRFEPAVFKGAPVGVWMTLPVRFALGER